MTQDLVGSTAPEIKVAGQELPSALRDKLTSLKVHTELGLVGRATLAFDDVGYQLAGTSQFGLGKEIKVSIDNTEAFTGVVTGSALVHEAGELPRLVITADDAAFRLGLTQKMTSHVNKTYRDIVSAICSAHGLKIDMADMGGRHPHVVQRTSDLAFVDMIARRLNLVWWVSGTTLNVARPTTAAPSVVLDAEGTLAEFSVRASGLRPLGVDVHGWDLRQKQNVVGTAAASSAPSTADSTFVADYVRSAPGSKLSTSRATVLTTIANPLDQDEATTIAEAQVAEWGASSVVARGTLRPGSARITLNKQVEVVNTGPMTGKYTVTSVEHSYDRNGLVTRFVCGGLRPAGLVDTLGGSSSGVEDGLTVRTLSTGIVTNINDPDRLGRVKVTFAGTDEALESDWARVMSIGGGKDRGVVFHPEVNDEVVVAFERGDTRRPVVLGGLVNGKDTLASRGMILDSDGGKVEFRRITSRLGHVIELADGQTADTQHIRLQLAGGQNTLRLGGDRTTLDVAGGNPFTLTVGNAKIAISGSGDIDIQGVNISINASSELKLSGLSVKVSANAELDLGSSGTAKLHGAMVDVEGSGQATLKGGIVMIN